jgi:hypothetical protein
MNDASGVYEESEDERVYGGEEQGRGPFETR